MILVPSCLSWETVQQYTKRYGRWSLSRLHIVNRQFYKICVSVPRREIFEDLDHFSYQRCYYIQPILFRSGDGLCEVYDIDNG